MEFLSFCRICLKEADLMQSIFTNDEDDNNMIYHKIMKCSSVKIDRDINLPDSICLTCLKELQISYKFCLKVENSNKILNSFINSSTINNYDNVDIKIENDLDNEFIEYDGYYEEIDVNLDIEEEILDTNSSEANENDEITELSTMKKEYEEIIQYNPENSIENSIEEKNSPNHKYISINSNSADSLDVNKKYYKKNLPQTNNRSINAKHSCDICGNKYKYNHSLQTHLRRHRNERPFSCEFCGKAFVLNVELKTHMRTHTGLKPYPCRYCERRFSDFGSRIKHERTHTGERPYVCKVCGKAFAYSYGLSGHMLVHTGEKPFGCETCGKHFNRKHHLKNHLQTHLKSSVKLATNNQIIERNYSKNDKLKILSLSNATTIIEEIITEELLDDEDDDKEKDLQYYVLNDQIDDNILSENNS